VRALTNIHYYNIIYNAETPVTNRTVIAEYLASLQSPDGGFRKSSGYPPKLNYTTLSLLALSQLGFIELIDLDAAISYIVDCQNPDGGFGNTRYYQDYDPSTIYYTWLAVRTLYEFGYLSQIDTEAVKNYIISQQLDDGSWGDTFRSALSVDILYILGSLDEINQDSLLQYIVSEPPRGVNYAGSGYLNTPSDEFPTVYSTWAGVLILKRLGKIEYASSRRISTFVKNTQHETGGFMDSAYMESLPNIYATYYAIDIINLFNLRYTETINAWDATRYALVVASVSDDAGAVSFAVFSLYNMRNIIVPYNIRVNATTVVQGDIIRVDLEIRTTFMDPISEADVYAIYDNTTVRGYEKEESKYYVLIDTIDMLNGTHNITLKAEKENYESMVFGFTINVFRYIYVGSIYVSSNEITQGENITVTIELVDRSKRPITNATVKMKLCDIEIDAESIGPGVYTATLVANYPGHLNVYVTAEKEGYENFETLIPIIVRPRTLPPSQTFFAESITYILIILMLISSAHISAIGKKGIIAIIISAIVGLLFFMNISLILSMAPNWLYNSILYLFETMSFRFLLFIWILMLGIGLSFPRKRTGIVTALSWLIPITLLIIFAYYSGVATYVLASVMIITAGIAYKVSPGEREGVLRELKRNIVSWVVLLMALSIALAITRSPFSVYGPFSPPAGISISFLGYLSLLWYMVYLFVPVITASKFTYLALQGLRPEIRELHRRLTTRIQQE